MTASVFLPDAKGLTMVPVIGDGKGSNPLVVVLVVHAFMIRAGIKCRKAGIVIWAGKFGWFAIETLTTLWYGNILSAVSDLFLIYGYINPYLGI